VRSGAATLNALKAFVALVTLALLWAIATVRATLTLLRNGASANFTHKLSAANAGNIIGLELMLIRARLL
jgi:hypothetical protein